MYAQCICDLHVHNKTKKRTIQSENWPKLGLKRVCVT